MDRADPLAELRAAFDLPADLIYLDGNSLGALPVAVRARLQDTLDRQWGEGLIRSWNTHVWIDLPTLVGEKIAPLLGAAPGQVICTDSISVNLFKLLSLALSLNPGRTAILSAADNFPSDLYMVQGLSDLLGEDRCSFRQVNEENIPEALDEEVAVLLLSHINFRSGRILPMADITAAARQAGVLVIWDLAHSAGVMPLALDAAGVDFAVGCGYKYLNGGPGSPAFVYAASRHQDRAWQPLSGWMGHHQPFAFDPQYRAGPGMLQFLCGTPPVLSMSALDAALGVFEGVDPGLIREKSMALGELFIARLEEAGLGPELALLSPRDASERGSQLAFTHPQAYGLGQALIERGVIVDFREPDILRMGFSPLYNSYADVGAAVSQLAAALAAGEHLDPRWSERNKVT
jgi:kynureninase